MFTIFTIPKPFKNPHISIIQRNAILSWKSLKPECQIILFGDEDGIQETAQEFNVECVSEIKKNEFGTPLLSSVFESARQKSKSDFLVYANCDIIFTESIVDAVNGLSKLKLPNFLASGRRLDLYVDKQIVFDKHWEEIIGQKIAKSGKLHGFSGMDYFIFNKNTKLGLPDFAVGVQGWDTWLVYHAKELQIPVIDCTELVTVVHQNHPPRYIKKSFHENERKVNMALAGGDSNMITLREADWLLTPYGLKKTNIQRRVFSNLALFPIWKKFLGFKRIVFRLIGIANNG